MQNYFVETPKWKVGFNVFICSNCIGGIFF